jgi:glycosyltransferase involved in cell wall biosynthesis
VRLVHYYPTARIGSGVTVALWAWAFGIARTGMPVAVLHAGTHVSAVQVIADPTDAAGGADVARVEEHVIPHRGRGRGSMHPVGLRRWLREGDVLVLHEGWVLCNQVAAFEARWAGIPYIVVPHGVYAKDWRGYLRGPLRAREAAERYFLKHARAVHLFFGSEAADLIDLAPNARWFAVPTGMQLPVERWAGGGGYFSWVGRIDPVHKGLDVLVEAVASLPVESRPRIVIRGYDYRGLGAVLRDMVSSRGVAEWVEIRDPVTGREKVRFMQRGDGCVHPSRWESYGLALMESLALGAPCLVSSGAHVAADLQHREAAIVVEPTVTGIADGLVRLQSAGSAMGDRGRQYVRERLAWEVVVPEYLDALKRVRVAQ